MKSISSFIFRKKDSQVSYGNQDAYILDEDIVYTNHSGFGTSNHYWDISKNRPPDERDISFFRTHWQTGPTGYQGTQAQVRRYKWFDIPNHMVLDYFKVKNKNKKHDERLGVLLIDYINPQYQGTSGSSEMFHIKDIHIEALQDHIIKNGCICKIEEYDDKYLILQKLNFISELKND